MSGKLRVLTYHRIGDPAGRPDLDPALVSATAEEFERQMHHLARSYDVVDLERATRALRGQGDLPRRPVLITFDDAYRDFAEVAWPILRRHGLPATLFVPTGFPDRPERSFWWDRLHRSLSQATPAALRQAMAESRLQPPSTDPAEAFAWLRARLKEIPHGAAMTEVDRLCDELGEETPAEGAVLGWSDLRRLAEDGVTLGSHTRDHALLTRLPPDRARREIFGSRRDMARHLGHPPTAFCYPAGYHDDGTVELVRKAGYETAFTTVSGHNRPAETDPLRIRRTGVTRRTSLPILTLRLQGWFGPVDRWRKRAEHARVVG